ncbi:Cation transporter [Quillaja saponaria]|uniref:Cation transporter n=1 Tax=Quillaja saponaria TaxID=32244 RepID=A0AAD7M456_QUISA|nr:Cation transporter [Quillaja saponaria]
MTIIMLLGGEVFTSMLGLLFARSKFAKPHIPHKRVISSTTTVTGTGTGTSAHITILFNQQQLESQNQNSKDFEDHQIELPLSVLTLPDQSENAKQNNNLNLNHRIGILEFNAIRCLGYVVLGYIVVVLLIGSSLLSLYISVIPNARRVLKSKGLTIQIFSVFTVVSAFTNCGFAPTNENMTVFKKNSRLLLLVIPQILLGNTLYPPSLRLLIWVLGKITKREEFEYILRNYKQLGYGHLLSSLHSCLLVGTCFGFILIQWILFCSLEWNSENMDGLNSYQKIGASLFQVANSRHAGYAVFDFSTISSATAVLFIVMMYLPPYTTFLPIIKTGDVQEHKITVNDSTVTSSNEKQKRYCWRSNKIMSLVTLSRFSNLVIFIILICITEREQMRQDPLNFSVLNVTMVVISAYGNVGYSSGYSCKRQLKLGADDHIGLCKDKWTGFVGRWSAKGKFILIIVMFFGRLKRFTINAGKAWDVS